MPLQLDLGVQSLDEVVGFLVDHDQILVLSLDGSCELLVVLVDVAADVLTELVEFLGQGRVGAMGGKLEVDHLVDFSFQLSRYVQLDLLIDGGLHLGGVGVDGVDRVQCGRPGAHR